MAKGKVRQRKRSDESLPMGADSNMHAHWQVTSQAGAEMRPLPNAPAHDFSTFVAAAQEQDAVRGLAGSPIAPSIRSEISQSQRNMIRRYRRAWWAVLVAFETLTLMTILAAALFGVKYMAGSRSAAYLIWLLLSFSVSFALGIAVWVLWDRRRMRARIEKQWMKAETTKWRRAIRERAKEAERAALVSERLRTGLRSISRERRRSVSRGRRNLQDTVKDLKPNATLVSIPSPERVLPLPTQQTGPEMLTVTDLGRFSPEAPGKSLTSPSRPATTAMHVNPPIGTALGKLPTINREQRSRIMDWANHTRQPSSNDPTRWADSYVEPSWNSGLFDQLSWDNPVSPLTNPMSYPPLAETALKSVSPLQKLQHDIGTEKDNSRLEPPASSFQQASVRGNDVYDSYMCATSPSITASAVEQDIMRALYNASAHERLERIFPPGTDFPAHDLQGGPSTSSLPVKNPIPPVELPTTFNKTRRNSHRSQLSRLVPHESSFPVRHSSLRNLVPSVPVLDPELRKRIDAMTSHLSKHPTPEFTASHDFNEEPDMHASLAYDDGWKSFNQKMPQYPQKNPSGPSRSQAPSRAQVSVTATQSSPLHSSPTLVNSASPPMVISAVLEGQTARAPQQISSSSVPMVSSASVPLQSSHGLGASKQPSYDSVQQAPSLRRQPLDRNGHRLDLSLSVRSLSRTEVAAAGELATEAAVSRALDEVESANDGPLSVYRHGHGGLGSLHSDENVLENAMAEDDVVSWSGEAATRKRERDQMQVGRWLNGVVVTGLKENVGGGGGRQKMDGNALREAEEDGDGEEKRIGRGRSRVRKLLGRGQQRDKAMVSEEDWDAEHREG